MSAAAVQAPAPGEQGAPAPRAGRSRRELALLVQDGRLAHNAAAWLLQS